MKIGHVSQKSFKSGEETVRYLEMIIRPPMMESATFTVSANKEKQNPNEPDFNIFFSINRKGDNYPSARVGALWNKISDKGTEYKNGYIETPAVPSGKMNISVFASTKKDGQEISWSHDVLWSAPVSQTANSGSYSDGGYAAPSYKPTIVVKDADGNETELSEDQIPF
jgi:uncharacterized protein (DUF736 family)